MRRRCPIGPILLLVLGATAACDSGERGARSGDVPWVTEVEIGAEDGADEETFGWVVIANLES